MVYLKPGNNKGNHILIRPSSKTEPFFIIADDLNVQFIKYNHKYLGIKRNQGRISIEISSDNYQVCIRTVKPSSREEKKYRLERLYSDTGASPTITGDDVLDFVTKKEAREYT